MVLLLGDLHIPQKCNDIPQPFKDLLVPGKFHYVLSTGNIGNYDTKTWIQSLVSSPENAIFAQGEIDSTDLSETQKIKIAGFTFGLIHGHQVIPWGDLEALSTVQNELNCDILAYGNTYSAKVTTKEGKHFIAPGTITGATHVISGEIIPSFALATVEETKADVYIYKLEGGAVKVVKCTLQKSDD